MVITKKKNLNTFCFFGCFFRISIIEHNERNMCLRVVFNFCMILVWLPKKSYKSYMTWCKIKKSVWSVTRVSKGKNCIVFFLFFKHFSVSYLSDLSEFPWLSIWPIGTSCVYPPIFIHHILFSLLIIRNVHVIIYAIHISN